MPDYVQTLRQRFGHKMPDKPEFSPFKAAPKVYGATAQNTKLVEKSPLVDEKGINIVQQVVGVCLYYERSIDETIRTALSAIASEQTEATEATMRKVMHLLNYLATLPEGTVRFHAS